MLNYWHNSISHIGLCIFTSVHMWNTTGGIWIFSIPTVSSHLPLCPASPSERGPLSQELQKSTSIFGVPQTNPSLPSCSSLRMLLATLPSFSNKAWVWRRQVAQGLVRQGNSFTSQNLCWEWWCQVLTHSPLVLCLALGQSAAIDWL